MSNDKLEFEKILEQRRIHYDSLLWRVTSIFTIAIGGLLTYQFNPENANELLSVFGFLLTLIAVYLATSFRLYRHGLNHKGIYKEKIRSESIPQWPIYILIFLLLEFLWYTVLDSNWQEKSALWVLLLIFGVTSTICFWYISGGKKELVKCLKAVTCKN